MSRAVEPDSNLVAKRISGGSKVIIDVDRAYQAGLGVAAACSYYGNTVHSGSFKNYTQKTINMMSQIGFDAQVELPRYLVAIYTFVTHYDVQSDALPETTDESLVNKYVTKYFPVVMSEIKQRGLGWINSSDFTYDGSGDDIGENSIMRGAGSWAKAWTLVGGDNRNDLDFSVEDSAVYSSLKLNLVH
jgi:hypothetical protein